MPEGKLTVIVGPMFSGKTSELISFVEIYTLGKKKIKVFKPVLDNRYDQTCIVSHSNGRVEAIPIESSEDIPAHLDGKEKAVFVDEIQFLDMDFRSTVLDILRRGINVYCSGLDLNFRNQPFETTMWLMAHADQVLKKKAVCHSCGEYTGTVSHKIVADDREIDVGGFDKYIATCRECYHTLNTGAAGAA